MPAEVDSVSSMRAVDTNLQEAVWSTGRTGQLRGTPVG